MWIGQWISIFFFSLVVNVLNDRIELKEWSEYEKKMVKLPDKDGLDAFQSTWNENKNTINKHEMIEASSNNHLRFDEIQ